MGGVDGQRMAGGRVNRDHVDMRRNQLRIIGRAERGDIGDRAVHLIVEVERVDLERTKRQRLCD